ncbi:phage holin family protein [Nocardia acidivorans]|uniref:phage holin family protein n=1 Tax=Nocardia acidivorans TaxID=404580 RepID=UPI0008295533|nr:phage holin family protein [Nocardia acidivorans]
MTGDQTDYGTAIEPQPGQFEQFPRLLFAEFAAWAGPRLHRAGKLLRAEFIRGVIGLAALGFALIAAAYGTVYFLRFLTELLTRWMPRWAALLSTSGLLLIPAAVAALFGLWQLHRLRSVRVTAAVAVRAGSAARSFAHRNRHDGTEFRPSRRIEKE